MTEQVWLTDKEVGKRFGSTRQWVWRMASSNEKFPQTVKLTTRWSLWEIEAFEVELLKNKKDDHFCPYNKMFDEETNFEYFDEVTRSEELIVRPREAAATNVKVATTNARMGRS